MKGTVSIFIAAFLFGSPIALAETQVFDIVKFAGDDPSGNPHNTYPYDFWVKEPDAGAFNGSFLWAPSQGSAMHLWGAGTGLGLRVVQQGNTKEIGWRIDGGAGGAGVINTNIDTGGIPGVRYATHVLAVTGTLTAGFHILEVTTNNSLGAGETITLDALEVYGALPTTLHDQVGWYFAGGSGSWAAHDATNEGNNYATGGSIAYTLGAGISCSHRFNGSGVALLISARWDWDTGINWSIDGGLSSGTLTGPHPLDGGSTNFRFPVVLDDSLPYGAHTLSLTNAGGGTAWDLIILDGLVAIDNAPPKTRYEISKEAVNNKVGFLHWTKWYQESNANASSGNQTYAFDSIVEGATQTMTFLFCGTGIDLGFWRYGNGEYLGWSVDDGASTGQYDTWWWLDGVGDRQPLPMTGPTALGPYFHKATVTNLNKSAAQIIVLDYFDVYNDAWDTVTEVENTDSAVTYSGTWNTADPDPNCSGGSRATTSDPAATMTLGFEGTSVAVAGWKQDICTAYNWKIDNGAGGSGTVDQYDAVDASVRVLDLIVNGLSSGPHTLEIAHSGGAGYIEIDYIAVKGGTTTAVDNWSLY